MIFRYLYYIVIMLFLSCEGEEFESWFVIKEIDLGGATRLEEVDDPFGLGRVMKPLACFGLKHVGQCQSSQTSAKAVEEASSVKPDGGLESSAFG